MENRVPQRPNATWIAAFQGRAGDRPALAELETYLQRVIAKVARTFTAEERDDLVQETFARIVKNLEAFRGESAFTTWAAGVATRVAFTELRRRKAQQERAGEYEALEGELAKLPSPSPAPDQQLERSDILMTLQRAIHDELTDRQRTAILAELRGLPTIEIAERMQINQNALYKLTHDARKKLRRSLIEAGFRGDSLMSFDSEASG